MELFVLILVVLLAAALIDLMVGVANDAVNFLNSAIGSKVAPRIVIMIVASLGILVGVTFASGMMEVARSGIFNPQMLTFPEVMMIFAATMLTDVLLLDFFNTFGLPTSTTVSLLFELLGASVAISLLKVLHAGGGVADAFTYINTGSVFTIIFAIVVSVVVAFIAGSIVQYLSRMLFTFDIQSRIKRYGAAWGGLALGILTYFILVKGAKGASFLDADQAAWLKANALTIAALSSVAWGILLLVLQWTIKLNVFKPIVLVGTFALAMAFAANDLVNFIGVPLAGFAAHAIATGSADPLSTAMGALAEPVRANTWVLLGAGIIMAITLAMNKKARSVTATTTNLGRQSEGFERFESIAPARAIVRVVLNVFNFVAMITPASIRTAVARRFDTSRYKPVRAADGEMPAFDLLRASVNLIVSALLISFGTSLKLPLSTTYVTFIVAMATALPDRAWGRDSAVYRISGVLTVVGGWFFTALVAATAAAVLAMILYYGQLIGVIGLVLLAGFLLWRNTRMHRARETAHSEAERRFSSTAGNIDEALASLRSELTSVIETIISILGSTHEGLTTENRGLLKDARRTAKDLNKHGKMMAATIVRASHFDEGESIESKTYAEVSGALRLLLRSVRNMTMQCYDHVDNNHQQFTDVQREELALLVRDLRVHLTTLTARLSAGDFGHIDGIEEERDRLRTMIRKSDKQQLKRSKKEEYLSRNSLLYLELLTEYEEVVHHTATIYSNCQRCLNQTPPSADA
ncbi:MAG: inorganic phosphate transporter [Bacteroidota bacterium]|jgi:phosphate/sulfate permease|nr:inorganic phosphate transporter [Bacteroidota bacterium]